MNNLKAVIFDMDGVLMDSEVYWDDVEKEFFASKGIQYTKEHECYMKGRVETDISRWIHVDLGVEGSVEKIKKERLEMSEKIYTKLCQPMPGVENLLKILYKNKIKMAVASSSMLELIKIVVNRFGWNKYFEVLFSTENTDLKSKPAPDSYLHTAQELGVDIKDCIVFEDSYNGLLSAKAADMQCIGIMDPRWEHGDFSSADLLVGSFEDKKILDFLGL